MSCSNKPKKITSTKRKPAKSVSNLLETTLFQKTAGDLVDWFAVNQRPLPWRKNSDPYGIWISEIMLQQTTVKAVIPYYEKFLKKFPTVQKLAKASIEDVYALWAGLGYYSRARNLKKAAEDINALKAFPQTYQELLKLPGFGPYTSRAVSSQAFEEAVGVVDGNVIRVLSRWRGVANEHWTPKGKAQLQVWADELAQHARPSQLNQALMELGATICTPQKPTCLLCPLSKSCIANKEGLTTQLPLSKPRRKQELWLWNLQIYEQDGRFAFIKNSQAPFLKGQWVPPGFASPTETIPETFDLSHTITHHRIFVSITRPKAKFPLNKSAEVIWLTPKQLKEKVPFSIIQKTIALSLGDK